MTSPKANAIDWTLYVLTDSRWIGSDPAEAVEAAIRGGATVVQLREKDATTRQALKMGEAVSRVCRRYGVPFIVNDRVDIMLALDADGVHLGPDDMPVSLARSLIGSDKLIGVSTGTPDEARRALEQGADYLGIGAVFGTGSKDDAGDPIGLDGFRQVREAAPSLPAIAIAGIDETNAAAVAAAGADGIAVITAVFANSDPQAAARRMRDAFGRGRASAHSMNE